MWTALYTIRYPICYPVSGPTLQQPFNTTLLVWLTLFTASLTLTHKYARTNMHAHKHAEPMFNVASYMNNSSLSDVVLVSEDGQQFFAHRLILCVQSPVFKTMLDSDLWADSRNKEVLVPYRVSNVHSR